MGMAKEPRTLEQLKTDLGASLFSPHGRIVSGERFCRVCEGEFGREVARISHREVSAMLFAGLLRHEAGEESLVAARENWGDVSAYVQTERNVVFTVQIKVAATAAVSDADIAENLHELINSSDYLGKAELREVVSVAATNTAV